MQDHYETLGVSKKATHEEIKKAYRRMARKYHPDVNASNPEAEASFKRVQAAWEVLGDPDRRADYDVDKDGDLAGARDLLALCIRQGLERTINAGLFSGGANLLLFAAKFLEEVKDAERRKTAEAQELVAVLKRQSGRVRRLKGGSNAFENIIAVEVEKAQAFIDNHDARVDEIGKVERLLRDYVDGMAVSHDPRWMLK